MKSTSSFDSASVGSMNTLVLSDLHLGEDLAPAATEATRLHVDIVERQLVQFLRHYTRRREGGRPWRLVFNGDLIDFLTIVIGPDHPDFALLSGRRPSPDEHKYGLRRTVKSAVAVVDAVARRHAEVFRALARFLARGNRVDLVCGNHDVELTWPAVQAAFRAGIARAWNGSPEASRPGAPRGEALARGVGFHPWFFYQPGELWIEHGHQYDECCSFEHQLDPRRPGGDDLVMNVDNAGARYVANRIAEAEESWSMIGYLRFGAGLGLRGFFHLTGAYLVFLAVMIAAWRHGKARPSVMHERRDSHLARLRRLAAESGLSEETLLALDAERRPPVVGHLRRLLAVLMLDRVLLYSAAIGAAVVALIQLRMPFSLAAGAGAAFGALGAVRVLSRDRLRDPAIVLAHASSRIVRHVDARFVVFGHTHEPVAEPLGDGRMYFNTGTWVPSGRPGILRSFTHLIVRRRETGLTADLCQWRDGMSRAFTPGWKPARVFGLAPAGHAAPAPAPASVPIAEAPAEALASVAAGSGGSGAPAGVRAAPMD
jgi:UDP-2,3-diacylglucosamine pyrophosphatase LpxH